MPTRYGRSPWIDTFPKSRVPAYPRHRGSLEIEAVIIGGGLTGALTAYAFAQAGIKVALLESERIGQGATAASAGWIGTEPGPRFAEVEKAHGVRAARYAWQSWRRAALDLTALLRRLDVKCHLTAADTLQLAQAPDQAALIKREHKTRKEAGLDASVMSARAATEASGIPAAGALRIADGALIDPYRATLGVMAAAAERGAQIFEHSPVRKITFTRKHADVHLADGAVRTARVIVATGIPTPLFKSLVRHFWLKSRYFALTDPIPARIRQQLGTRHAVIADQSAPSHVVRWVDDERMLVTGADGDITPERLREKTLVQRTGQLMYELSTLYPEISGVMPAYGWDSAYSLTTEGLPYIGAHRNFPHHLFAFGDASHGLAGAFLASRLFLRHHTNEAASLDEVFGFNR